LIDARVITLKLKKAYKGEIKREKSSKLLQKMLKTLKKHHIHLTRHATRDPYNEAFLDWATSATDDQGLPRMSVTLPPNVISLFRDPCNSKKHNKYELWYKLDELYKTVFFKLSNPPYSFPIDESCSPHITEVLEGRLAMLSDVRNKKKDWANKQRFYGTVNDWINKMVREKSGRMVPHDSQCRDWSSYYQFET